MVCLIAVCCDTSLFSQGRKSRFHINRCQNGDETLYLTLLKPDDISNVTRQLCSQQCCNWMLFPMVYGNSDFIRCHNSTQEISFRCGVVKPISSGLFFQIFHRCHSTGQLSNAGIIFDRSPQIRCGDTREILTVLMNKSHKFVFSWFSIRDKITRGDLVTLVTMYYYPVPHLFNLGITPLVGHDINCM